jgi:hypothetical protein
MIFGYLRIQLLNLISACLLHENKENTDHSRHHAHSHPDHPEGQK